MGAKSCLRSYQSNVTEFIVVAGLRKCKIYDFFMTVHLEHDSEMHFIQIAIFHNALFAFQAIINMKNESFDFTSCLRQSITQLSLIYGNFAVASNKTVRKTIFPRKTRQLL